MIETHGMAMTADRVMRSHRISRMAMEHNTKRACANSSLGCGTFTRFDQGKAYPHLAHTVGLAERGLAELVMLGCDQIPNLAIALDAVARWWDDTNGAKAGICPYDPRFKTLRIDTEQFLHGHGWMLGEYYRLFKIKDMQVFQILEQDAQGHWPDEPQFKWQVGQAFALPQEPFGVKGVNNAERA